RPGWIGGAAAQRLLLRPNGPDLGGADHGRVFGRGDGSVRRAGGATGPQAHGRAAMRRTVIAGAIPMAIGLTWLKLGGGSPMPFGACLLLALALMLAALAALGQRWSAWAL